MEGPIRAPRRSHTDISPGSHAAGHFMPPHRSRTASNYKSRVPPPRTQAQVHPIGTERLQKGAGSVERGLRAVSSPSEWRNETHGTPTRHPQPSTSLGARGNPKQWSCSLVICPSSVGPSNRVPHVIPSHRMQASSGSISSHRRPLLQPRSRVRAAVFRGGELLPSNEQKELPVESETVSSKQSHRASKGPCVSPLRKRRTWVILQQLVDHLNKEAQVGDPHSNLFVQHPEALEKLLQALMPLMPLRERLRQLLEEHPTSSKKAVTGSLKGQQSCKGYTEEPKSMSARQIAPSNSLASRRGATSTAPATEKRSSRLLSSPPRWRSVTASRYPSGSIPTWPPTSVQQARRHPSLSHNGYNKGAGQFEYLRRSPWRATGGARYEAGSSAALVGVTAATKWYEKPQIIRATSTGRYANVTSRLPRGALDHRRLLKGHSQGVALEKYAAAGVHIRGSSSVVTRNLQSSLEIHGAFSGPEDSESSFRSKGTSHLSGQASSPDRMERPLGASFDWVASNTSSPHAYFTCTRCLEAVPPSSREDSNTDREETTQARSFQLQLPQNSEGTEVGETCVSRTEPSSFPRIPTSPRSPGRRQQLLEPGTSSTRRQTVATPCSPRCSTEGDRQRRSPDCVSLTSPPKRERHLSVGGILKGKTTSGIIKGGRIALPGEEDSDKESSKSQGSSRVPRLKDIPKAKEARRATTQIVSPKSLSALSTRRATVAKVKPERSPTYGKTLLRKDSKNSFLKSPRTSPGDLSPPTTAGRRMSAPPLRRATQAKATSANTMKSRVGAGDTTTTFKASATRRKTVKLPIKRREQTDEKQKEAEASPPEADTLPHAEEKESKAKEPEAAIEEPPEPPYPFLKLAELPMLQQPLRIHPTLSAIPLKDGPEPPPAIDDSVTLVHVLERSERLTETGRDNATQRAISCLCSEGPAAMLLMARWMDTAADAIESNSVAIKEGLPWRDVVPPFFVGLNTHRELLSPRLPRSPPSLNELRAFLQANGFIETQEQKLRQLLERKGVPEKPSNDLQVHNKIPKDLDNYLDYLLAVTLMLLRARRQPQVIPKITRFVVGANEKGTGPSSLSASCSSDQSVVAGSGGEACRCGQENISRKESFEEEFLGSHRRCFSCLHAVMGPSRNSCCRNGPCSSFDDEPSPPGCGFPCCCFGDLCGPLELDPFESTAVQQVRASVSQMHVLPSEKYMCYLRLTGRRRELRTMAIWLSGRADTVPSYEEYMARLRQRATASQPTKPSTHQEEQASSSSFTPSSGDSRDSRESSGPPSVGGRKKSHEETDRRVAAVEEVVVEIANDNTDVLAARQDGDPEDLKASRLCVSLCSTPRSPTQHALTVTPISPGYLKGKDGDIPASSGNEESHEVASACGEPSITKGPKIAAKHLSVCAIAKPRSSMANPALLRVRTLSWDRPAEPTPRKGSSPATTAPHHPAAVPVAAPAAARARQKQPQPRAKSPLTRMAPVSKRTPIGAKRSQAPLGPGRMEIALCLQKGTKVRPIKQPPESVHTASAVLQEAEKMRTAGVHPSNAISRKSRQGTVTSETLPHPSRPDSPMRKTDEDKQHNRGGSVLGEPRTGLLRFFSSKAIYVPENVSKRRPSAPQSKRYGVDGRVAQANTGSHAYSVRSTHEEALDLLTEPQMLAEMASLCVRLSDLLCCRPTAFCAEGHSEDSVKVDQPNCFRG